MSSITTFLTFDNQAEAAVKYYVSFFPNSRITGETRYSDAGPGPSGSVMTMSFELDGHAFIALNGGPHFKFTDGISLSVSCKTQQEVDRYWNSLSDGGDELPCGWVKDRFGLFWQVNPTVLGTMLADADRARAGRVMEAMLKMKKIIIADLQRAYEGK